MSENLTTIKIKKNGVFVFHHREILRFLVAMGTGLFLGVIIGVELQTFNFIKLIDKVINIDPKIIEFYINKIQSLGLAGTS